MQLLLTCHKCGKEITFESEKATRVFEDGTEAPIYKVFCPYCGSENNALLDTEVKEVPASG